MGAKVIEYKTWTKASPATTFAIIADARSWPDWSPLGTATLEEEGAPTPDGLGALRNFVTGRVTSRERVVVFEPDRRFGYELVSGLPLKNYRALVELTPRDGGTAIHWRSTFDGTKVPGAGWLYRWQLGTFIGRLVEGLVDEADARAADEVPSPAER